MTATVVCGAVTVGERGNAPPTRELAAIEFALEHIHEGPGTLEALSVSTLLDLRRSRSVALNSKCPMSHDGWR